ncbi:HAD superfamily hydrolase (plasmid) [Natrialba magadii ATCC 43099]|uniref:HAD superfamily hydrolase n=1 Tax=Natrialba magadii (strain ATCC 43099 / DSM 3394 / CCM 3739 / CIP 104546 / IAM 13178 / JCM 8861 / NBRC 102185 / NCIMB 2190 / MS3) TaxID=547559 RepID=D3T1S4_NATMM|nr:hypothetical protein [Natrialba magadii]ADD07533.1 HAD superfamily hydrolase [Natrialba magadii ATCC 43099]ELY26570.1 hypothetical protein C500_15445 [Natrialba magadii ATCC 43099]
MKVALDLEGVLANSIDYFLDQYNASRGTSYVKSDIDSWNWVPTVVGFDTFDSIVNHGWRNHSSKIQYSVENLPANLPPLIASTDLHVDIVTARTGVEESMKQWVTTAGIPYDRFVSIDTQPKPTLQYDVFIDDNPVLSQHLSSDQTQYLVSQPWNENTACDGEQVRRVPSVLSAFEQFSTWAE